MPDTNLRRLIFLLEALMSPARLVRILFLPLLLLFASVSQAQITNVTADQAPPTPGVGHDYNHFLNETVNPATGSVSIRVAVPVPPGRGMTIPFSFGYDSNAAFHKTAPAGFWDNSGFLGKGGWSYVLPQLSQSTHTIQWTPANGGLPGPANCTFYNDYILEDAGGVTHDLNLAVFQPNNSASCEYPGSQPSNVTSGGDGYVQAQTTSFGTLYECCISQTISSADGTVYYFSGSGTTQYEVNGVYTALPNWIEDRNGNKATFSSSSNGAFTMTDTAGRPSVVSSGFGSSGNTITVYGLPAYYTVTWGTAPESWTGNFQITNDNTGVTCPGGDTISGSLPVVTEIALSSGETYQFLYTDGFSGRPNKIIYPGNGYIQYVWGPTNTYVDSFDFYADDNGSLTCHMRYDNLALQNRYVSFDGVNVALEEDYSYQATWVPDTGYCTTCQIWTGKTTTVVTKDCARNNFVCSSAPSFTTTYSYSPYLLTPQPYDQSYAVVNYTLQWGQVLPHRIPIEQTVTHYSASGTALLTETKGWDNQYLMMCELRTLDNGLISGSFYSYGNGGVTTDVKEYDFGVITSTSACPTYPNTITPPSATPLRETITSYQTFADTPIYPYGPSILDRPASVITNGNGTRIAETDYAYDQFSAVCAGSPSCVTPTAHDEANYGPTSSAPRGNATTVTKQCFNGPCGTGNPANTDTYDETGQLFTAKDPNGNLTQYSYADNYSSCSGAAPPSSPTNAYVTSITNALRQVSTFCYGYGDGQLRGATDPNLQTTTYVYNAKPPTCTLQDSLGRLGEILYPDGGTEYLCYNDSLYNGSTSSPSPSVTTTRSVNSGTSIVSVAAMDGVGHVIQSQLLSDPDNPTYTVTAYDGLGRSYQTYNPTRCNNPPTTNCGENTWGLTTTFYDSLDRACLVVPPDGALPSSSTCPTLGSQPSNTVLTVYSGNTSTVTDQAGKSRESFTDGLGRLTKVLEDPYGLDYETDYTYDALDDLLCVGQKGTNSGAFSTTCSSNAVSWRPRSFSYDSLSRLTSATNPESGTTSYSYDADGNLVSKTVPAQNQTGSATVTLSYCYDALNRIASKAYTAQSCPMSSAIAAYTYDQAACLGASSCFNVGRRTGMTDQAGSEAWSYDQMGRPLAVQRTTNGITRTFPYTYNYDGSTNTLIYPVIYTGQNEQVTMTYTQGGAGRPIALESSGNTYVATNVHYAPNGQLCYVLQGWDGDWYSTTTFNNRLQPSRIQHLQMFSGTAPPVCGVAPIYDGGCCSSLVDLSYNFYDVDNHNNGNVIQIANNLNTGKTQSFSYDSVNRLATAETAATYSTGPADCWSEQYTIDPWGNLSAISGVSSAYTGCTQESLSLTPTTNNQLEDTGDDYVYDASGNLTQAGAGGNSYTYDAENHLISANGVTYTYDGDGNRVTKSSGTMYWYGANSASLEESDLSGNLQRMYYFFGGQRVARQLTDNEVGFYLTDHLGSVRYLGGSSTGYSIDYYPFGGIIVNDDTGDDRYQFTGKERDAESGLDNFINRYNSSSLGRFMSPDPANFGAVDEYPQTWNAYSYVANNPLNAIDPNGLDCVYLNNSGNGVESIDHSSNIGECQQNGGYWANGNVPNSSWVQINQNNDTATIYSQFSNGGIGVSVASQTWTQGAFGLGETFPSASSDDLNPFARGVFTQLNQMNILNNTLKIYGTSVVLGVTGGVACYYLCPEAATVSLAGETGTDLIESTNTLNKIIGGPQRELLKEFFETGKAPEGLSQRTLQIYKQIAQRAISAGKDQLGVQAQRIQMISNALK
jgi:RHS repeat-associated protein